MSQKIIEELRELHINTTEESLWDDICTKENILKIWKHTGRKVLTKIYTEEEYQVADKNMAEFNCVQLLIKKLNGEDWESELLKHLKGKEL